MNKKEAYKLVHGIAEQGYQAGMESSPFQMECVQNWEDRIIEKISSKPVMPKVFHEWYKRGNELKKIYPKEEVDHYAALSLAYVNSNLINKGDVTDELAFWLDSNPDKYLKCIDAIRYGYEVEK